MHTNPKPTLAIGTALTLAMCALQPAAALPLLGTDLAAFTVLGASTVTNVGPSSIVGNVGVWSSGGANAITGFNSSPGVAVSDPQVVGGKVHAGTTTGTPNAMQAQLQLTSARNNLASLGVGTTLALPDMAGLTLVPGVYTVPAGPTRRANGSKTGTRNDDKSPPRIAVGGRLPMLDAAAVRWLVR